MLKFDWNILFTLINLVIFYLLMKRFLFKPILKVMNERKEMIKKQFSDADAVKAEALELKEQYENSLQGVDDEKGRILAEARQNAKTEYDKIIDRAHEDVKKMKSDAMKQIESESEKARRSAKEDIASLAIEAAEKVVAAKIDADANSNIFDEFLNESSDK
ncbi:MAG: F0F1 ATP synthase subunit B [Eubacterium sp.]